MITQAITEMNQKKGSSRVAILKHIAGATNSVPNAVLVKKTMKKMVEDGILVPGAQAGKSGSGSFKVSPGEKLRLKQAEKVAAKKVLQKEKKATAIKTTVEKGTKKIAKKGVKKVAKKSSAAKTSSGSATKKVAAKNTSKLTVAAKSKKVGAKSKKVVAKPKKVKK